MAQPISYWRFSNRILNFGIRYKSIWLLSILYSLSSIALIYFVVEPYRHYTFDHIIAAGQSMTTVTGISYMVLFLLVLYAYHCIYLLYKVPTQYCFEIIQRGETPSVKTAFIAIICAIPGVLLWQLAFALYLPLHYLFASEQPNANRTITRPMHQRSAVQILIFPLLLRNKLPWTLFKKSHQLLDQRGLSVRPRRSLMNVGALIELIVFAPFVGYFIYVQQFDTTCWYLLLGAFFLSKIIHFIAANAMVSCLYNSLTNNPLPACFDKEMVIKQLLVPTAILPKTTPQDNKSPD